MIDKYDIKEFGYRMMFRYLGHFIGDIHQFFTEFQYTIAKEQKHTHIHTHSHTVTQTHMQTNSHRVTPRTRTRTQHLTH